jgi:putative phage-type endonuclease
LNVIDISGMTREQWLALRRQSIGASDAPVIAGLSKYKSRFALWLEKTSNVPAGEAGEEARWGLALEDDICDELSRQGVEIWESNRQQMIASDRYSWLTATVDGFDSEGEGWQLKATTKYVDEGEPAPADWLIQVHQEMYCADRDHWNIAAFVGRRLKLARWRVERDDEVMEGVLQLAFEFWQHVQDRTLPAEFDPSDAALLLKHYGVEQDIISTEDAKIRELAKQYEIASAAAEFQAELADQLKAALLGRMQTACAMRCGPYLMKRSTVNVKAQEPKPKAAYSYTKFSFSNTESEA